jgi:tetratricopeptide (TPR) repeat protein
MGGRLGTLVVALTLTAALGAPHSAVAKSSPCDPADALKDAGEAKSARKAYTNLLLKEPSLTCAQTGLKDLNAPQAPQDAAAGLCAQGEAYRRAGRRDDAEKAFTSAVAKDPSKNSCGEKGLDALDSTWTSWVERVLAVVPDVAAGIGVGLVALLLLLMLGYSQFFFRIYRRIKGVRWILRPRLALDDLGDRSDDMRAGAAVTARVRERLQRFREEVEDEAAFASNLDFGTSTQELAEITCGDSGLQSSLDKLADLGGHTGAVAALIGLVVGLLPIKRFSFSGIIEPASGPSASATMSFQAGSRQAGSVTLTGKTLDHEPVAGDYLALAAPAAVWVQYEVARAVADQELPPEIAESYALVREGLDHYVAGNPSDAITAFEQALELDSRNWPAKVNLAVTKARLANDFDVSEAILEQAVEDFKSDY